MVEGLSFGFQLGGLRMRCRRRSSRRGLCVRSSREDGLGRAVRVAALAMAANVIGGAHWWKGGLTGALSMGGGPPTEQVWLAKDADGVVSGGRLGRTAVVDCRPVLAFVDPAVLQYRIETYLTWNPMVKSALLLSTLFAILLGGGAVYYSFTNFDIGQAYWRTWCALSGAEPDFSDDPWDAKVLVILMTVVQLFFFAFQLSLVEQAVANKVAELNSGRTKVFEVGHEVILGWNPAVPMVLKQLAVANRTNRESQTVVILADKDKKEMDRIVRAQVGDHGKYLRVMCRSGDPSDVADQDLVAVTEASRILVLSSNRSGDDGADAASSPIIADNLVFKTALALKARTNGSKRTILETHWHKSASLVPYLGNQTTKLNWSDLVTKLLVQSAVEGNGFAEVQRQLLRFEDSEWYLGSFPSLVGKTFAEAGTLFRDATLAGIQTQTDPADPSTSHVNLNPEGSTVIEKDSKLVYLAEDKTRVSIAEKSTGATADGRRTGLDDDEFSTLKDVSQARPKGTVLVLGWRRGMASLLHELDRFYAAGTVVRVVASSSTEARVASLEPNLRLKNIRVQHVQDDMCDPRVVKKELSRRTLPMAALVLLDESEGAHSVNAREARVLSTLVALKVAHEQTAAAQGEPLSIAAELETENSAELARKEGPTASVVVLDEFSACFIAQAAYNPDVLPVHQSVLSSSGADISFRSPPSFLHTTELHNAENPVPYSAIAARAQARGDILLGFIRHGHDEPILSPPDESIVPSTIRTFIVLEPGQH